MPEYVCIGCGTHHTAEDRPVCPVCGLLMFPVPFERSAVLRAELARFVGAVIRTPYTADDLLFSGYQKDQHRFPELAQIFSYVSGVQKTEQLCARMKESAGQLRSYLHTPFSNSYKADPEWLWNRARGTESLLEQICHALDLPFARGEITLPEVTMDYSVLPSDTLLPAADGILDGLNALADKIYQFVRRNNLFGAAFQPSDYEPADQKALSDENLPETLNTIREELEQILQKKYVIDLLDDGAAELSEMQFAFWKAFAVLRVMPLMTEITTYTVGDESGLTEETCLELLTALSAKRFAQTEQAVTAPDFLSGCAEERLAELYNTMLDLDEDGILQPCGQIRLSSGSSEQKLSRMIGLRSIKASILKIKAYALANRDSKQLNLHMCFYGNPGTGKSEAARLIAGILHENGFLPADRVVETDRSGLVAGYVGQTALKTREKIKEAMGGVLFIDEAYALIPDDSAGDYGYEAVAELIKAMEDHRGKFCVILAGYENPMQKMLDANPGFSSRIQFSLHFPNYSREELAQISALMLKERGYSASDAALSRILDVTDLRRKDPNFANARDLRNVLEQVIMCQSVRCIGTEDRRIELTDVSTYLRDAGIRLPSDGNAELLSADDELDRLVGLAGVKRTVRKIKAYAKRNCRDADFNLHMCFYGNPGTGKSEVARLISRILYDAGVLPEAKLTETSAPGLIGKYVGETGPKTQAKINDAMGGVLFIDEAYSLTESGGGHSYGDEAIAVLLKEMEDHRGQLCVIFAGYKEQTEQMLAANPGMKSRIPFILEFPDYTREELGEIARVFLEKKHYDMTEDAVQLLLDICEYYRRQPDFANARTVRNVLDQVIMNQNLRTEDAGDDRLIIRADVEDYLADEQIDLNGSGSGSRKIGFS